MNEKMKTLVSTNGYVMYRPEWNKFTGSVNATIILQLLIDLQLKAEEEGFDEVKLQIKNLQKILHLSKKQVSGALKKIAIKKGKVKNKELRDFEKDVGAYLVEYYTTNKKGDKNETFWKVNWELLELCLTAEIDTKIDLLKKVPKRALLKESAKKEFLFLITLQNIQYYLGKTKKNDISNHSASSGKISDKNPAPKLVDKCVALWNKYNDINSLQGKLRGRPVNRTAKKLLPTCRKITPDIKKAVSNLKKMGYDYDDFKYAVSKYLLDIINRDPGQGDYCAHRFSFYEFVKQKNGFVKFVNK
ncbi:MAG TPA: hypothetical protein ENJ27_00980 [Candidatus Moranbacteria bacterium]|nr:hypothetical protein [Candidatus Moranbacteria bacterium]